MIRTNTTRLIDYHDNNYWCKEETKEDTNLADETTAYIVKDIMESQGMYCMMNICNCNTKVIAAVSNLVHREILPCAAEWEPRMVSLP